MPVPRPPPHLPRPPARSAPGRGGEGPGPDPGCGRLREGGSGLSRDGVSGAEGRRGAVATSSRTASGSCPPIHPQPACPAAPAPRVAPPRARPRPLPGARPCSRRFRGTIEKGEALQQGLRARPLAEPRPPEAGRPILSWGEVSVSECQGVRRSSLPSSPNCA